MSYQSVSHVIKAGVATEYGGSTGSPGAAFVWLQGQDDQNAGLSHDWWFEIRVPWANQALATALAAMTSNLNVEVLVGEKGKLSECNSTGDPYCYRIYLSKA